MEEARARGTRAAARAAGAARPAAATQGGRAEDIAPDGIGRPLGDSARDAVIDQQRSSSSRGRMRPTPRSSWTLTLAEKIE